MITFFEKLIVIQAAFAQGGNPTLPGTGGGLENPLKYNTIEEMLVVIWEYLFAISIPIVAIMVIIGAFQIMFAAGNVEKVKTGRKTVLYAVIGFAIVLAAGGIVAVVKELLGVTS